MTRRRVISLGKDAACEPDSSSEVKYTPLIDYAGVAKVFNSLARLYDSANDKTVIDKLANNLIQSSMKTIDPPF